VTRGAISILAYFVMEMFPTYKYWQRPCETLVDSPFCSLFLSSFFAFL